MHNVLNLPSIALSLKFCSVQRQALNAHKDGEYCRDVAGDTVSNHVRDMQSNL